MINIGHERGSRSDIVNPNKPTNLHASPAITIRIISLKCPTLTGPCRQITAVDLHPLLSGLHGLEDLHRVMSDIVLGLAAVRDVVDFTGIRHGFALV